LRPSGEPLDDAARLGPFATLLTHAVIARAERGARRSALRPRADGAAAAPRPARGGRGPIVVVQCESFFDARRLSPLVPRGLLAGFDRACEAAVAAGRLGVPGWGANTMRAEFAVLTGIPESALGYDRFNPYYALARTPLDSHVWRLRRAGYRTVCLHPFDRRFFRRDLAMPALGFERFLGRESLGGSRTPPYYPDPRLAEDILRIVEQEGPDVFVFAITMGNHGPWLPGGPPLDAAVAGLLDPAAVPDGAGLLRYLDGLKRSDTMLHTLLDGLERHAAPAVLAFYGDHLPSLPRAFAHFGFAEGSSDYVVWSSGGRGERRDIAACELGGLILAAGPAAARSSTDDASG
jgi:phosphoglycerol transferase MdoB-like AlkP superfamily enzyme